MTTSQPDPAQRPVEDQVRQFESVRTAHQSEMVEDYVRSLYLERKTIPVVNLRNNHKTAVSLPTRKRSVDLADNDVFRDKLSLLEEAMAGFLNPGVFHHHSTIQDQEYSRTTT